MTSSNSNKPVTLYGNTSCPYCGAARMLLTRKGIDFDDIIVTDNPALLAEMQERSGRTTVPQVLVGDAAIGGFDELSALDKSGELEKMLAG
ncbi:MAG: glutaredoxin 3 [Gammaproteobacteria bacterium]|nr:glutaredoxin 3 [Gammaproteobacteria bacterium]MBT8110880.1 glutaredoxin 3 [Gammaproteobacteria bacterium]NND47023.1 glutaredoxin 3 [Woeseiaceae bacterium]NNL45578.1 glutaredoxin 3 [Woeseiaceae bacterium]